MISYKPDLWDYLQVLLTPTCWMQNYPLSKEWDQELTWLLDNRCHFTPVGQYRAQLGNYEVWISNHPYASFTFMELRPRRTTLLRAHRQWLIDVGDEDTEQQEGIAIIRLNQHNRYKSI